MWYLCEKLEDDCLLLGDLLLPSRHCGYWVVERLGGYQQNSMHVGCGTLVEVRILDMFAGSIGVSVQ